MNKLIFSILVILFIYYLFTLFITLLIISIHVENSNDLLLDKYLDKKYLSNNFKEEIYEINELYINKKNININILDKNFNFSGELTPNFFKKTFLNIAINLSKDLSNSKNILFFYNNSNELKFFFINYINNLGNYSFDMYIKDKIFKDSNDNQDNNNENLLNETNNKNLGHEKKIKQNIINLYKNYILRLIKKYNYTDYFFLLIHYNLK